MSKMSRDTDILLGRIERAQDERRESSEQAAHTESPERRMLLEIFAACDAKRNHNYREGADSFTITTREYTALRDALLAQPEGQDAASLTDTFLRSGDVPPNEGTFAWTEETIPAAPSEKLQPVGHVEAAEMEARTKRIHDALMLEGADMIDELRRELAELSDQLQDVRAARDNAESEANALRSATGRSDTKLWLWKNFVDGRPEYWAFDNPYPTHGGGDPMTLGEPCGYAIFKESTVAPGRKDVPEADVLAAIRRAADNRSADKGK